MRVLATVFAYAAALVATGVLAFLVVVLLAGPHAGLLPSWLEAFVLGIGWLAVLVLPVWVARKVWGRFGRLSSRAAIRSDGTRR